MILDVLCFYFPHCSYLYITVWAWSIFWFTYIFLAVSSLLMEPSKTFLILLIFLLLFLALHVNSFIDIPSPALISPLSLYDLHFFSRALHILTIAILNSLSDNSNINTIGKFGLMVFCLLRLCFIYLTMATLYNFSVEIQTCYFRL